LASTLVTSPVAVGKAFSPGHITGFFEITHSTETNLLYRGSRGAGFSIEKGITTSVQIYESRKSGHKIMINGVRAESADVSEWVVGQYHKLAGRPFFARIDHEIDIPVGFGLGSSGAAALSLSYALNEALGVGLSRSAAAQIAHVADVTCKTGLGTVIAEYSGGFEMRTLIGGPGIGTVSSLDLPDHVAVVLCLSPISTKAFLTNRIDEINGLGGKMLERLSVTKQVNDFLRMSREFAETIGLTEGVCKAPIKALRASGIEASVALFGETVFTLVPRNMSKIAHDALRPFGDTLFTCGINSGGARVL
jgi:pantoate kinase